MELGIDMKKIFIYAYMAKNLGDDLMVRILCERYPNTKFYLFADAFYKTAFKDLDNLTVFSPDDKKVKIKNSLSKMTRKTNNGFMEWLM